MWAAAESEPHSPQHYTGGTLVGEYSSCIYQASIHVLRSYELYVQNKIYVHIV